MHRYSRSFQQLHGGSTASLTSSVNYTITDAKSRPSAEEVEGIELVHWELCAANLISICD